MKIKQIIIFGLIETVNLGPLVSYNKMVVKNLGVLFDKAFKFDKQIHFYFTDLLWCEMRPLGGGSNVRNSGLNLLIWGVCFAPHVFRVLVFPCAHVWFCSCSGLIRLHLIQLCSIYYLV